MCNEAITKTFTFLSESWTTDRISVNTIKEFQLDCGSIENINAPFYLIAAHQKTERIDPADPARNLSDNRFNNAFFDKVYVRKYFEEFIGIRYPNDPTNVHYTQKKYLNQYRDLKLIYKE